jgi:hypothetical protein
MKALHRNLLQALLAPLLWTTLLVVEITLFSAGRAQTLMGRLFEDLVFFTSFLFYTPDWGISPTTRTFGHLFLSFTFQFLFWWLATFLILILIRRRK